MAKGIIVVDMPERCKNCDFIRENFHGACCERKADGEGLCKEIPIEIIRHGKPYWCPIKEIPVRLEELKCPHSMSDLLGSVDKVDDLISRKALINILNILKGVDKDWLLTINQIIDFIEDQPIAFDKEKVIEELEDYLFEKYCVEGDEKVAEIVEKGGIE